MQNLPPPPPAHITPVVTPRWVTDLNGQPVWRVDSLKTRLVAVCWEDGAAPSGWMPVPTLPDLLCFSPDLRTAQGQLWQKRLNASALPQGTPTNLAAR